MKTMAAYKDYLEKAGPEKGPLTEDQLLFRIEVLQDSWWLEHLCIEEREAALLLAKYRSQLWKVRNPEKLKPPTTKKKGR